MKIVIDIPEEYYNGIKAIPDNQCDADMLIIKGGTPLEQEPKTDTLDKIKGYIDHIRNTGMGKEKSLEFIEKFIDGLKAESEVKNEK